MNCVSAGQQHNKSARVGMRHVLLLAFLLSPVRIHAQPAQQPTAPAVERKQTTREYSLPPDKLQKAIDYSRARNWLHFVSPLYEIAVLLAILSLGLSARFRDWAEGASKRRFIQAVIFVPLLSLTNDALSLPLGFYGQHLELIYEQSVQSWTSWLWDWTKGELIGCGLGIIFAYILYGVIRRSPRSWWFYFWLASLPIIFTIMFLEPVIIEPLFFKFEPLQATHPSLVDELERVVTRGGLAIPPERMFEMKASEKLKSLNAYVSGLGASKRVVVWDTTLARMSTPEILFVFGHEMGHYVLGHVRNTLIFLSVLLVILLYVGYHGLTWLLRLEGERWRIRGVSDWASLPVLLLILTVFSFLAEPIINGYSRTQEHAADVYGLEVAHGIVPNISEVAAHSFQVLGEVSLDEPHPHPFIEFWMYSHPSTAERIAFSQSYDPWSGGAPRYVK